MKIGYVLMVFPKLSEMFVLNEILELKRQGHEVVIFSIFHPFEKVRHKEVDEFNLLKNTHYVEMRGLHGKVKSIFRAISSNCWEHPTRGLKEKLISISAAKHFSSIAINEKVDVLHAHFNNISAQTALIMSKQTGIPYTFMSHAVDIYVTGKPKIFKNRIENSLMAFTESVFNQNYIAKLSGCDKSRIKVVHIIPNMRSIGLISKERVIEHKGLWIVSVARLVEKKGLEYSIKAIKIFSREFNVKLTIVGKGPLQKELDGLIESLGLKNQVKIINNL